MESCKEETKYINPFSLKSLKNNEKKEKHFFDKLTDVLMSFHILPFFNIKEAKELGKIIINFIILLFDIIIEKKVN